MKKAHIYIFWVASTSSVGISKYKRFVAKSDYDKAIARIKELEEKLNEYTRHN